MYTHHQFKSQCELVMNQCYYKEGINRQNLLRDEQHLLQMLQNSYHHNHSKELQLIDQLTQDYRHLQMYIYLQNIVKHVEKNLHIILNYSHDPFQMSKKLTKQVGTIQYAGHHMYHFPELHSLGKMFREYFGMNIDQFEVCSQMIELCTDLQLLKNLYLSYFCKNYGLMAITIQQNGHYFTELYKTYDFYISDEAQSLPPGGYNTSYPTTQLSNSQLPPPYGQIANQYPQQYNPLPPPGQQPPQGQQLPYQQQYPNYQPNDYGNQPYQQGQSQPYQQSTNPIGYPNQVYPQQQINNGYPSQNPIPSPSYPTSTTNNQQYNPNIFNPIPNPTQQQGYSNQLMTSPQQSNNVPMPPPVNYQNTQVPMPPPVNYYNTQQQYPYK